MTRQKRDIDELTSLLFSPQGSFYGPRQISKLSTRLTLEEAIELSDILHHRGYEVQPYSFPGTIDVWSRKEYRLEATKRFLEVIAKKNNISLYKCGLSVSIKGFKELLPYLTARNFSKTEIDEWGTTPKGVLKYNGGSPASAVLELIENDYHFARLRRKSRGRNIYEIRPYDFSTPQNTWVDKDGLPTELAREAVKKLILSLVKEYSIRNFYSKRDKVSVDGMRMLLPYFSAENFRKHPINIWGTTLTGALQHAYHNSTVEALSDVFENDPDFTEVNQAYRLSIEQRGQGKGKHLILEEK